MYFKRAYGSTLIIIIIIKVVTVKMEKSRSIFCLDVQVLRSISIEFLKPKIVVYEPDLCVMPEIIFFLLQT